MQDRIYGDLRILIQSLAGTGSFTTEEQTSIDSFVNRRYNEAYNMSQSWPRYLVVGEERSISSSPSQTIPYTQSGKNTIGEFIRIHRTQPFLRNSALEFDFYVDYNGAHILNLTTADANSAFVTYKTVFSPFELSPGDDTEVPGEFFNYIAHGAYADFLRMDGQHDKAMAEEKIAGSYLALELEKLDVISNNSTVNKRFTTYVNRQSR
jgi:hypothetical protein